MASVYRCRRCSKMFKGSDLNYCPFCGERLEQIGMIVSSKGLQDYLRKGWKLILFRKEILEWCPSCSKYTYHIRTADNIIRCKECGHGKWY